MTQWCIYWFGISSITRPPFSGSSQEQYLDFSLKHLREHPPLVLRPTFVRWSSSNATVTLRLVRPRRPPVRGKRSIPTILWKKRGTIYCASVLPLSQSEEKTPQLTITWGYPKELYHCAQKPARQAPSGGVSLPGSRFCLVMLFDQRQAATLHSCFESQHYPRQARST